MGEKKKKGRKTGENRSSIQVNHAHHFQHEIRVKCRCIKSHLSWSKGLFYWLKERKPVGLQLLYFLLHLHCFATDLPSLVLQIFLWTTAFSLVFSRRNDPRPAVIVFHVLIHYFKVWNVLFKSLGSRGLNRTELNRTEGGNWPFWTTFEFYPFISLSKTINLAMFGIISFRSVILQLFIFYFDTLH